MRALSSELVPPLLLAMWRWRWSSLRNFGKDPKAAADSSIVSRQYKSPAVQSWLVPASSDGHRLSNKGCAHPRCCRGAVYTIHVPASPVRVRRKLASTTQRRAQPRRDRLVAWARHAHPAGHWSRHYARSPARKVYFLDIA